MQANLNEAVIANLQGRISSQAKRLETQANLIDTQEETIRQLSTLAESQKPSIDKTQDTSFNYINTAAKSALGALGGCAIAISLANIVPGGPIAVALATVGLTAGGAAAPNVVETVKQKCGCNYDENIRD